MTPDRFTSAESDPRALMAAPAWLCLALVLAVAVQSLATLTALEHNQIGACADRCDSRINPNTAPWWELTALPRVGEITAKNITAYRDGLLADDPNSVPFRAAHDLQKVRGIGPKTVERLRPHLKFE